MTHTKAALRRQRFALVLLIIVGVIWVAMPVMHPEPRPSAEQQIPAQ